MDLPGALVLRMLELGADLKLPNGMRAGRKILLTLALSSAVDPRSLQQDGAHIASKTRSGPELSK